MDGWPLWVKCLRSCLYHGLIPLYNDFHATFKYAFAVESHKINPMALCSMCFLVTLEQTPYTVDLHIVKRSINKINVQECWPYQERHTAIHPRQAFLIMSPTWKLKHIQSPPGQTTSARSSSVPSCYHRRFGWWKKPQIKTARRASMQRFQDWEHTSVGHNLPNLSRRPVNGIDSCEPSTVL